MNADTRAVPPLRRLGAVLAIGVVAGGVLSLASGGPARAHVELAPSTTEAGAHSVVELSFAHGCDGAPTTGLAISIPEGIEGVTPTRKAGWQLTVDDTTILYSADVPVPDGEREVFELVLRVPDAQSGTVVLPTIQQCGSAETAWIEIPSEGQDAGELEHPAPSFAITAASGAQSPEASAHAHGAAPAALPDATASADPALYVLTFASLGAAVFAVALAAVSLRLHRRRP